MRAMLAVWLCWVCAGCASTPGAAEREVLDAVQGLFDGMRVRDPDALRPWLCEDAQFVSVELVDGRAVVRPSTAAAFLASVGSGDEAYVERMFSPEVDVRGDFAFAQLDYDFHRGEAFSHHGVDQFLLVREQGRWRVASIAYSVVRGGAQSPFGGL